ncbi:hypothetical protein [Pseudoxanthomonas dokdonensis]|uniref:Uncharacterized protein n=1 Tax=Pseudoxanthomonas dokdonensis TaxID=344882 RepID=A0A0R0CT98_9GAMM|nr:hypothetical protein [Pseudoxanthomonas dokdonensis]KRG69118.1 hypothetical protein ABB29_11930 [Pseudoxanthomonas dokdonensis]
MKTLHALTVSTVLAAMAALSCPQTFIADAEAGPRARGGAPHSVNRAAAPNRGNVSRNSGGNRNVSNNRNVNSNRNINTNHNVNVNSNRHVDVDVDVDHGWDNDWNDHYHPIATTAAVVTTAAVIGSIVNSVPSSGCQTVMVNNIAYQQCGSTWYQPQYAGSNVQYVVVNSPY